MPPQRVGRRSSGRSVAVCCPPVVSVPARPARCRSPHPGRPPFALTALLAGSLLAALVWLATRLDPVDAWVMRWQELASAHARGLAVVVSATLGPVGLLTMVAGAALGWLVKRRDLVALALAAVLVTLAVEILLKRLVHRQWEGGPALVFPSGHAAISDRGGPDRRGGCPGRARRPARPAGRRLPDRRLCARHRRGAPGRDGAPADRRARGHRHRPGGDPGRGVGLTAVSGSERVPSGERCSRSLTRPPHPRCRTQLVALLRDSIFGR